MAEIYYMPFAPHNVSSSPIGDDGVGAGVRDLVPNDFSCSNSTGSTATIGARLSL